MSFSRVSSIRKTANGWLFLINKLLPKVKETKQTEYVDPWSLKPVRNLLNNSSQLVEFLNMENATLFAKVILFKK